MDKKKLENIAKKVIEKSNLPVENYGSVILVLMFISIIITSVRVIQECNKNKTTSLSKGEQSTFLSTDVRFRSSNHSFLTRMRLRKILKNHLTKDQYKVYGDVILQTLLEVGKTVKEEQVSALLEYENV